MTLSTRPRFGRASRRAPEPRAAPQDWNALERITSSLPAHGLDSTPQRERGPSMVYPPMDWTRFAPSAQSVGDAPRVERARNDRVLSGRPW
eukprot:5441462-Pyramimonas_sp.AAC.1